MLNGAPLQDQASCNGGVRPSSHIVLKAFDRHPNLVEFDPPDRTQAAMMKADCKHASVVDYRRRLGHTEELSVAGQGTVTSHARIEDWGALAVKPDMLGEKKTAK